MIRADLHWWTCMIGGGAIVFALLFCTGCAGRVGWVKADGSSGYAAMGIGHKEREVAQSAESFSAAETSTEQGFRDLRIAAQTASVGGNLVKLGKTAGSVLRAKEVTSRAATSATEATRQAGIAADVQKTAILNPSPE